MDLQVELGEVTGKLDESLSINKILQRDFLEICSKNKNVQQLLDEEVLKSQKWESEASVLQDELNTITKKYNNTCFELESAIKKLNAFDQNVETHLRHIEELVFGSEERKLNYDDKIFVFHELELRIENNKVRDINDKKLLCEKLEAAQSIINHLEKEINDSRAQEELSLQERHNLQIKLTSAKNAEQSLQKTVNEYGDKIDKLKSTVQEMALNIIELEQLKVVIEQKDTLISELEVSKASVIDCLKKANEDICEHKNFEERMTRINKELENQVQQLEDKLAKAAQEIAQRNEAEKNLLQNLSELTSIKTKLASQFEQAKLEIEERQRAEENNNIKINELINVNESLKQEIVCCNDTVKDYEKQIEIHVKNIEQLNVEKCNLVKELKAAQEEIVRRGMREQKLEGDLEEMTSRNLAAVNELNHKVAETREEISKLEQDLKDKTIKYELVLSEMNSIKQEKADVEKTLQDKVAHYKKNIELLNTTISRLEKNLSDNNIELINLSEQYKLIVEERDKRISTCETLQKSVEELSVLVTLKEKELSLKDDLEKDHLTEITHFKYDLLEKNRKIEELQVEVERLNGEINNMKYANQSLTVEIEEKESEYKKEIQVLVTCKSALEKKCKEFEEKNALLLEKLKLKECELNDLKENLKSNIQNAQKEIESLNQSLNDKDKKLEELTSQHNTVLNTHRKEIEQLHSQLQTLNLTVNSLTLKELQYIEQIHDLKDELNTTLGKYTEVLQIQQEMKLENEVQVAHLTENLHDIVKKYNNSEKTQAETAALLNEANMFIKTIESEKSNIETQLLEQKENFEKLYSTLQNELTQQIHNAAKEKDDLTTRISKLLDDLTFSEEQRKTSEIYLNSLQNQLEEEQCKNSSLGSSLENLQSDYSSLEEKYNDLNLMHDSYVKESTANLAELSERCKELIKEKEAMEDEFSNLSCQLLQLESEKKNLIVKYEDELNSSSNKILRLQHLAIEYDAQMTALEEIKKSMQEKCTEWKELYEESLANHDAAVKDYECKITNSKCAQEILETGKQMLQKECDRLAEELKSLQQAKQAEEDDLVALIKQKNEQIVNVQTEMQQLESNYEQKESKLLELNHKLIVACNEVQTLKGEQKMLEDTWKREKEAVTEEQKVLEKELKQQKDLYQSTLQSYNVVLEQLESLKTEKLELEKQLYIHKEAEIDLKCLVKDYENVVVEKTQELNSLKVLIQSKELTITELNKQMENYLKNLSLVEVEKGDLQKQLEAVTSDLEKIRKSRDEVLENQTKIIKETEINILRAHENAEKVKTELLKKIENMEGEKIAESKVKHEIEDLLAKEIESRKALEAEISELTKEKLQFQQVCAGLERGIEKLNCILENKPVENWAGGDYVKSVDLHSVNSINETLSSVEDRILEVMEKKKELLQGIATLEKEKVENTEEIQQLKEESNSIIQEKEKLICDYDLLNKEKCSLLFEKTNETKSLEELQAKHDLLQARYEQMVEYSESNEHLQKQNDELQKLVIDLRTKQAVMSENYEGFCNCITKFKADIKTLVAERVQLDQILTNLRINMGTLQTNMASLNTVTCKPLVERKANIDIIVDDIYKQSSRLSKRIGEVACKGLQISEDILNHCFAERRYSLTEIKSQLNVEDDIEKINDLKDRAADALQQIQCLNTDAESKRDSRDQLLKENVALPSSKPNTKTVNTDIKTSEEEWKKKNMALKQRLTLSENAKLQLERKVKQLREENKKLTENTTLSSGVVQKASNAELELGKIRDAYACLMTEKSQLQLEIATMKNALEDRTQQLGELNAVKEAYEHLLEENNKLMTEIDTLNYKRTRDREEYTRMLLKEREECQGKESKRIQDIRNEYEGKLGKMKEKMVSLNKDVDC